MEQHLNKLIHQVVKPNVPTDNSHLTSNQIQKKKEMENAIMEVKKNGGRGRKEKRKKNKIT
jgi:hypothetical protein